jgi:hypothetical protein
MVSVACASPTALVAQGPAACNPTPPATPDRPGTLLVYSATYAPTIEQSEYPVHTKYSIATTADMVIKRVPNLAGSFYADPAKVTLPAGAYHVRAQYDHGGFVVIPVCIEPGKTTIVDLSHERLPAGTESTREPIRLPDGRVVGWLATTG